MIAAVVLAIAVAGVLYFMSRRAADAQALATLKTADFHALAFSPDDPNVVFFGHHNGVLRSDDGGRTWRSLVDRRNFDAMNLAVNPASPGQVYLAGHDVFQVSSDGGASWRPVSHNLPGTDIHGFTMSPEDPNRLFALVVGHGLYRSADGGRTWMGVTEDLPNDVMALGSAGGNPDVLYAGSMRSGVLRSADGGQHWAPGSDGLNMRGAMALAVDPSVRQTVYAGLQGGLAKSTDDGATWRLLPFPGRDVVALAVSRARPNTILAVSAQNREGLVYRSSDGGQTWDGR